MLSLLAAVLLIAPAGLLHAQNTVYNEIFTSSVTPTTQCTNWTNFRASLNPGTYTKVVISGTYDVNGQSTDDITIVNALASAIKNFTNYQSPLTYGNTWSFCINYYASGGVNLNNGVLCNSSDCPSPGYYIRPCIGNLNWGGVNTATCSPPTQYMRLSFEKPTAPNDAGVASVDSPLNFCAGTYPVTVTVKNYGKNQITSFVVNWKLNGVAQTPVPWTGMLDTLTSTTRQTQVTLLPSYNFLNGTPYNIKAWTSLPNNQADTVYYNDTVNVTRQAAISGTYTIGGASPNFPSFSAAVASIAANGICGPVVFKVRTGTYNEQVTIPQIAGASAVNTITFESETGVNTDVTLTYSANSTLMYTLLLDGADYIRFNNMTITGTNTSYARIVMFQGAATYNIFTNNRLIGVNAATTSNYCAVIYSYYTGDSYNEFNNNLIQYGGYGVYFFGSGTGTGQQISGLKLRNNTIKDFYYMGCYLYYMDAPEVTGNLIQHNQAYTFYGLYGYYWYNKSIVTGNKVIALNNTSYARYGMYLNYVQANAGQEGLIANNFISLIGTTTVYGMYLYYPYNMNVEFNTVVNQQNVASGYTAYLYYGQNVRYMNNILYNTLSGYLTYFYTTTWRGFDYNIFYTPYTSFGYWNGTLYANWPSWQAISGANANSLSKALNFKDLTIGDLHLAGASQNDLTLTGVNEAYVSKDIDGDPRILPYRGADEACYILPGTVDYRFVDANSNTLTYVTSGSNTSMEVTIAFPNDAVNANITVYFYTVPGNVLSYTYTFSATKLVGQTLKQTYTIPIPANLATGYYRVSTVMNTKNSCGDYINYTPTDKSVLVTAPGQTPCLVWPGDVNNDGVANYGDRTSLNQYIFNANLRPTWLTGPARYRPDYLTNPLTYYTWEAQAGAPWITPEGCYMDADGNGVVNSYDMIPIKVNFMKTHGFSTPKSGDAFAAGSFDMSANYPNPFNPSTTIQYSVPERSTMRLVVTDLLGREVATLVNGTVESGVRTVTFDASNLESGVYVATASMTGLESGLTFSKTIRMTLTK